MKFLQISTKGPNCPGPGQAIQGCTGSPAKGIPNGLASPIGNFEFDEYLITTSVMKLYNFHLSELVTKQSEHLFWRTFAVCFLLLCDGPLNFHWCFHYFPLSFNHLVFFYLSCFWISLDMKWIWVNMQSPQLQCPQFCWLSECWNAFAWDFESSSQCREGSKRRNAARK